MPFLFLAKAKAKGLSSWQTFFGTRLNRPAPRASAQRNQVRTPAYEQDFKYEIIDIYIILCYNNYGTFEYPKSTKTVAVASLNRERRFFFCLPERGGDANVRYLGIAVPLCRTYNFDTNIHRQS